MGHIAADIAELPLFITPNTHLTFKEAKAWSEQIEADPLPTNISQFLTYHDFRRFKAEELSTDGYQEATVALFQGIAFLMCLIAGEIFLLIGKTTAVDAVEFKFNKTEVAALSFTVLQGFISLGLGSLKGKIFAQGVFMLGFTFAFSIVCQVRLRWQRA